MSGTQIIVVIDMDNTTLEVVRNELNNWEIRTIKGTDFVRKTLFYKKNYQLL